MNLTSVLRRPFTTLACAAALLAATGGALAEPGKGKSLELKIGVAISETLTSGDPATCPVIGNITGGGYATELGAVTVQATDCFAPTGPTSFAFVTHPITVVTLTTASGEALYGTYSGTAVGNPFPVLAINGNVTFNGGTGRFKRASGSGTLQGVENIGITPAVGFLVISGSLNL